MKKFNVDILPQPTDSTCGPTSLHAVYSYYGDDIPLQDVIDQVHCFENGGTLAVFLAIHALKRGYRADIGTYNLHLFDPTWFNNHETDLSEKLRSQLAFKQDERTQMATEAYLEFMKLGGRIFHKELTPNLLKKYLRKSMPILTGLSATYLYQTAREYCNLQCRYDDIKGDPVGHFVVLSGYSSGLKYVTVTDPFFENPISGKHVYDVDIQRLINAILLGIVTYDANILIIQPPSR